MVGWEAGCGAGRGRSPNAPAHQPPTRLHHPARSTRHPPVPENGDISQQLLRMRAWLLRIVGAMEL